MDVLIGVFGGIAAVVMFLATIGFFIENDRPAKLTAAIFLFLAGILIWDYVAIQAQEATAINISCPIIVVYNTPCYKDENGVTHEITGDQKFNDPVTYEMVVKKYSGGWRYGIYVTEGRTVSMQRKVLAEAQK